MRARHRHFNPKDAGAVAAYDARFITGLSDGDNISTWSSRTGTNNATQATVANQPNYETNEINGNPVVNFTPANNDELTISITIPASCTIIAVHRRSTTGIRTENFGNTTTRRMGMLWWVDNVFYTQWSGTTHTFTSSTRTGSLVITSAKDGTTSSRIYISGDALGSSVTPSASSGTFTSLGRVDGGQQGNNGAMGAACLLDSFASDSLRRRLEHAAAYSFKLACS